MTQIDTHTSQLTRKRVKARRKQPNVVAMPLGETSHVADFLRYHELVRVFDGDADRWLAHLNQSGASGADLRFARWLRRQLRRDDALLPAIRRMVDQARLWQEQVV